MKLTSTRHGVRLFSVLVVFGAWLLTTARADAQVMSNQYKNWKTESQALDELTVQIDQVVTTQNGQTPGTPAYNDSEAHLVYYKMIQAFIAQGKSVEEAIQLALGYTDTTWLGPDYSPAVQAARSQWYSDAQAFLTN